MRPFPTLLLLLLSGCATSGADNEALVDNLTYRAAGAPSWGVYIGDDIVVHLGHDHFDGNIAYVRYLYPAATPRHIPGGIRRWRTGRGRRGVLIEAHPGPCTSLGGSTYEDHVRILHRGQELTGCGGRLLQEAHS
jgi:hypothetical protein